MQVTFKGKTIEVPGNQLNVGDKIPNVTMTQADGKEVLLMDLISGKTTILSIVPDVLTRTCELQTKMFADQTKDKGYQFITVSRNTPAEFNQWNEEMELDVQTLSDLNHEFGEQFALNIDFTGNGNELLTRSVFVINQDGLIEYVEYVDEVTEEPSYKPALEVADKLA